MVPALHGEQVHRVIVVDGGARAWHRWRLARPFLVIGAIAIVSGGLVAAATRPLDLELGPWLAAFLVLVVGVAQITLGGGQIGLAEEPPTTGVIWTEALLWNGGVAMTVLGTYGQQPLVTTLAAIPTIAALVLFASAGSGRQGPRWLQASHRAFALVILVSVPIGVALAWSRHG